MEMTYYISVLLKTTSHMWVLSTWDVLRATKELKSSLILIHFNLNNHMWPEAIVLDCTVLDAWAGTLKDFLDPPSLTPHIQFVIQSCGL